MNCGNCKYCIPCKKLVNFKWEVFKICNLYARAPYGSATVVEETDRCECFEERDPDASEY